LRHGDAQPRLQRRAILECHVFLPNKTSLSAQQNK
jgi:hypothetical protein